MEIVNVTPTWSSIVNLLIHQIENGRCEARKAAVEELKRMAEAADLYNQLTKEV